MKAKYEFWYCTRYVNSTVKDIIELDHDDDATEEEIEKEVNEALEYWTFQQIENGWNKL